MKYFLLTTVASVLLVLSGNNADGLNVKMPGMNYNTRKGPDWAPESSKCKNAAEIQRDMYALKAVTDKVRIYSLLDCNQAELVLPAAKRAGLQVHLGIWTTASHSYLLQERAKLAALIDTGLYDNNVIGLHVGSETIYRKEISADTAIRYMNETRVYIRSRGKNTPVTIADTIDIYNLNPKLVDAVDYVSVNQFSFWEKSDVNEGAAVTLDRLRNLRTLAASKNKKVVISEVGWSSGGFDVGAGIASPENQVKFFADYHLMATAHNFEYYWYVAFDSKWRVTNGGKEVEADFGVFREDDMMKSSFQQLTVGVRTPRAIRNAGTRLLLSEKGGNLYMSGKSNDWLVQEQQVWFFDAATQQVRSKSSDRCLDAYQGWDGGIVHVFRCMDQEANQKWMFYSATGTLRHMKHQGFCLDTDPAQGNRVQLYGCSSNNANQQWIVINPENV
ncbi:unnamed protein product [Hyaloperonospora brassicae]|uniref:glucan endo-1,3-beta-D-glucosidase n=1 Tax=Hyaloperonospora brassicae TaxID=162125 RepID=A0AAV0SZH4_HYABA|nr:unnamed protein product [Hyaloperonospora brassicae]